VLENGGLEGGKAGGYAEQETDRSEQEVRLALRGRHALEEREQLGVVGDRFGEGGVER
jgi:hypothetical protein